MNLFRKIFGSKVEKKPEDDDAENRYMSKSETPIDERFMLNFKTNGGKFLYCETIDEVIENFNFILEENNWKDEMVHFPDTTLKQYLKVGHLNFGALQDATCFFITCENLIADNGSILLSSNQIAEKKINQYPDNAIIFASTSQIVTSIGDGLQQIKHKNKNIIPTNITTIKHFKKEQNDTNFLNYGSLTKNLYLLLLEDF